MQPAGTSGAPWMRSIARLGRIQDPQGYSTMVKFPNFTRVEINKWKNEENYKENSKDLRNISRVKDLDLGSFKILPFSNQKCYLKCPCLLLKKIAPHFCGIHRAPSRRHIATGLSKFHSHRCQHFPPGGSWVHHDARFWGMAQPDG